MVLFLKMEKKAQQEANRRKKQEAKQRKREEEERRRIEKAKKKVNNLAALPCFFAWVKCVCQCTVKNMAVYLLIAYVYSLKMSGMLWPCPCKSCLLVTGCSHD